MGLERWKTWDSRHKYTQCLPRSVSGESTLCNLNQMIHQGMNLGMHA